MKLLHNQHLSLRWGAALALTLLCVGCQDSVNTVENAEKTMIRDTVSTARFNTDSFCRDRLFLSNVSQAMTPGGVLKVQATVRSERYGFWSELWSGLLGDNPYHVDYRFDWFDANGMQVTTAATNWHHEIFIPGETKFLQSVAPNSNCVDFLLSIKESDAR